MIQQTSLQFFAMSLYEAGLLTGSGDMIQNLLEQAREMYQNEIEAAIIKDCATESTSAASSYAEGYKDGYNRAIELTKWAISNLIPPGDGIQ